MNTFFNLPVKHVYIQFTRLQVCIDISKLINFKLTIEHIIILNKMIIGETIKKNKVDCLKIIILSIF